MSASAREEKEKKKHPFFEATRGGKVKKRQWAAI
jgi:hypothetical protein